MDYFYIAVLDKDCEPHYYKYSLSAENYLETNKDSYCVVDPNNSHENAEVWNSEGISVGYFYKVYFED